MIDYLIPIRLTRRDIRVGTAADSRLAVTECSSASGETAAAARNLSCFYEHEGMLDNSDLASRATMLDANNNLAAQLGDGKETNGTTNRPYYQTNPALFAAPHFLSADSNENFCVVGWIPAGRPRNFKYMPA
jgi:hypothetical protein